MHAAKRMLALAFSFIVLMTTAANAEVPFLVHSSGWSLDGLPVEVLLKADVDLRSPFDEDRVAMLTPITDLLSLRLVTGENAGSVTIGIAGEDKLTLQHQENAVQLSSVPEVTYIAESDPLSLLLGTSVTVAGGYEALHLAPESETLLEECNTLLSKLPKTFEKYGRRSQNTTTISGYGKAAYCMDYTFAANQLESFKKGLMSICPEGWVHEILSDLVFSGKQAIRMHFTQDDVLLRAEYNGSCGSANDLRTVQFIAKVRHDEEVDKDYIKLTSPAKKGKNRNNLTFERSIQTNRAGARMLTGSFDYTAVKDDLTNTWNGRFDLKNAFTGEADVLTGEVSMATKIHGADVKTEMILTPKISLSGTQEEPCIAGTLSILKKVGGRRAEDAVISIDLKRGETPVWTERQQTIDLSAMDAAALAAEQQKIAASVATTLVRPLIVLLGKDAAWFFRDLPEDAVTAIVDAAAAP